MKTIKHEGKLWGLVHNDEPIQCRLVKHLNRDNWSLRDIHEATQMIEQNLIIKEVICDLLVTVEGNYARYNTR